MNLYARRRAIAGENKDRLPYAYQKVEYLKSTGTQYFWTDIDIQDGLKVVSIQTVDYGNDSYLFGGNADNSGSNKSCFNGAYQQQLQGAYPSQYYIISDFYQYDTICEVSSEQGEGTYEIYKDNTLINKRNPGGSVQSTGAKCVCFGARNTSGNAFQLYKGKLYSLKVYKGEIMLGNFVPCIRKADDKPGMYDTVTKTFYTNAGTGEFIIPD